MTTWNKKKKAEYQIQYRKIHPEGRLFHRQGKGRFGKMRMLFELGGCCVFDFETNPFYLEICHPFGRSNYPDIMIQACRSCHKKLDKIEPPPYTHCPSEETRRKMSEAHKGFLGKHHSKETRLKISKAHAGKSLSKQHRLNISLAQKRSLQK